MQVRGIVLSMSVVLGFTLSIVFGVSAFGTSATNSVTAVPVLTTILGRGMRTDITIPPQPIPPGYSTIVVPPTGINDPAVGSVAMKPQVPSPNTLPCRASQVQASVADQGPFEGMGEIQDLVVISSKTTCSIDGYPKLEMSSDGNPIDISVVDGGVTATAPGPNPVEIGPSLFASFVLRFGSATLANRPQYPTASSLEIELPNGTNFIPAPLTQYMLLGQTGFDPYGGKVWVTPFEPGNSSLEY